MFHFCAESICNYVLKHRVESGDAGGAVHRRGGELQWRIASGTSSDLMWNAWIVRRDLLILKMEHVHYWSADVSGISGAVATGAD